MANVTIGFPGTQPTAVYPPAVYLKATWADSWTYVPEVECVAFSRNTAASDLDSAVFVHRYGHLKHPWETSLTDRVAINIVGYWARVDVANQDGSYQQCWVGKISGEARDVWGRSPAPSGIQTWTAYGPLQLLRKIAISESYWTTGGPIGWLPNLNERRPKAGSVGNKSPGGVYGGDQRWSHKAYIDYLIEHFLRDANGPTWTLAGTYSVLDQIKEAFHWGDAPTVADMLAQLIPPRYGLDYYLAPTADGFAITVFPLAAQEYTFGDATIPSNGNTVSIQAGLAPELVSCKLVLSEDNGYGRVRLLGGRIVACLTLKADGDPATLVPKWTDDEEQTYLNPGGADAWENDEIRKDSPDLADVFAAYGAPTSWSDGSGKPTPYTEDDGTLVDSGAEHQNSVRRTLAWLPLVSRTDYTHDPPVSTGATDEQPEYLHPMAWLEHPRPAEAGSPEGEATSAWTQIDKLDPPIGIEAAQHDWGLLCRATPNHLLAKEHWADEDLGPTQDEPYYDYEKLRATIAIECDQRLTITKEIPGASIYDGTLDVVVNDAQLWLLMPDTMLGVDEVGHPVTSPSETVILRDDTERLELVMAGIISRYQASRMRAEITAKGLWPWPSILGSILLAVNEGNQVDQVKSPITSITWQCGADAVTTIRAGYAS